MAQIVLDAEAFRALSSDTRLSILKALDARRLTVSELGRLLGLNKATVHEHLQQLTKAELVKKEDEGRKWIYYRLTWKGKNVVHPENVQFMLLLATSILSVGGVLAQLGRLLDWWGVRASSSELSPTPSGPSPSPSMAQAPAAADRAGSPPSSSAPVASSPHDQPTGGHAFAPSASMDAWWHDPNWWLLGLLVALLVAAAILLSRYARDRRRARAAVRTRLDALPPAGPDEETS